MRSRPVRQLVLRGVNWLGDAVMTTPAVLRLRERFPDARITMLCPEKLRDLWTSHPSVDAVLSFAPGEGVLTVARRLRAAGADTAVVLPNSFRSALEVWASGIPRRVGAGRFPRNLLLTDRVAADPDTVRMRKRTEREVRRLVAASADGGGPGSRTAYPVASHQGHHYLRLAGHLGADPGPLPPRLQAGSEAIRTLTTLLAEPLAVGRPLVGINPGAEYGPAKRWPVERFAEASRSLAGRTGAHLVVFGGKADLPLADGLAGRLGGIPLTVLAGRTTLAELLAALSLCRVLITNDTGPMHLAGALGVPVVVPFGSTSPELTGPGLPGDPRHRLLLGQAPCAPCFLRTCPVDLRCLHSIPPEAVVAAALAAMGPGS